MMRMVLTAMTGQDQNGRQETGAQSIPFGHSESANCEVFAVLL